MNLRYTFLSYHNIHKSSCGLCFSAPDPLIDRFYSNPPIKGFGAQKQRPHELLWMLWCDEKVYVTLHTYFVSSSLIVHSLRQALYVLYV